LGLLGYHRLFVHNYAEIAKPLTDLTSKKCPAVIPWTEVEQRAFERLTESLCLSTALHTPRIGELYILRTDASAVAIGSMLSQLTMPQATVSQVDVKVQNEQPVAPISVKNSPPRNNDGVRLNEKRMPS
jgi:RNase H-like domain found in reverse transcriptase